MYLGRKTEISDIRRTLELFERFFEKPNSIKLYAKEGLPYMFFSVEMLHKQTFVKAKKLARYGTLFPLSAATCMELMITHFNMKRYRTTKQVGRYVVKNLQTGEENEMQC